MSLSTLRRSRPPPLGSLASLTNDSLLVILGQISLPHLLPLLTVCRRVYQLIVEHTLAHYRSILMLDMFSQCPHSQQQVFFTRRSLPYHTFSRVFTQNERDLFYLQPTIPLPTTTTIRRHGHGHLYSSRLRSFPRHLPSLFRRLRSFSFVYYLAEEGIAQSGEEAHLNRLLTGGYLSSSGWSGSLLSLQLWLHLQVEPWREGAHTVCRPGPSETLFGRLNALTALRHLFLGFTAAAPGPTRKCPLAYLPVYLLPDNSMATVLGQLESFTLQAYKGANVCTLLHQLPASTLTSLSLLDVICAEADFVAFLRCRPAYRETLQKLELRLSDESTYECTTPPLATLLEHCPSLRHFSSLSFVKGGLFSFFDSLSRLTHLQAVGYLHVSFHQLVALPRHSPHLSLPRLPPTLRRLSLSIVYRPLEEGEERMLEEHLPLLGRLFGGALSHIEMTLKPDSFADRRCPTLSQQLAASMREHFPTVHRTACLAHFWIVPWHFSRLHRR